MNTFFRTTALALCSTFVLVTATLPAGAAEATPARVTFDGQIRNNSLALSPDEATAVVSYSERPDVIVYDLVTGAVRGVLRGYVTPRNIVFAPDGKSFYVSDSSLGTVTRLDTT
nr:phosphate ABC transporter substrate-binding protein [Rubrivivax sp.]